MRNTARLTSAALVSAMLLGSCSTSADEESAEAPTTGSSAEADGGTADAEGSAADDGTEVDDAEDDGTTGTIGIDFPDPDDVIADATFTVPGTEDEVRVGVESLTVQGEYTELRLVFTPLYGDEPVSVYDMTGGAAGAVDLIDREHLKEYRHGYTTDSVHAEAAQGESVAYQAFFSAPEDDIDVIDVKVTDSWPVFEDVPLTVED